MSGVTAQTIDVKYENETFTFRMPTIKFDVEVAYRAANIRHRAVPEGQGFAGNLDYSAIEFARCAALMELYLEKATVEWPWTSGEGGKPAVDFEKWPLDQIDSVYGIGAAFQTEMSRFRRPRAADQQPAAS